MKRRTFLIGLLACTALTRVQATPVTLVGAIYAVKSKLLQRVYIPSFYNDEIDNQWVHPKETLIKIPLDGYVFGGATFAQSIVGKSLITGRCAIVDANNIVVDMLMADPDIYYDNRGRVIPSDDLNIGDIYIEIGA